MRQQNYKIFYKVEKQFGVIIVAKKSFLYFLTLDQYNIIGGPFAPSTGRAFYLHMINPKNIFEIKFYNNYFHKSP